MFALAAFVAVYTLALGFGWLRQTPSQEELYGDVGRFIVEFGRMFSHGGISWWDVIGV